jgi:hypothetical protein
LNGMAAALSDWSDYEGDDDADFANDQSTYNDWCNMLADADERLAASFTAEPGGEAGSSARDGARGAGGRPAEVEMDTTVIQWLCDEGYSNAEIAAYFGHTEGAVKQKKHRLGMSKRARVELPPLEVLQAVWEEDPRTSVAAVAAHLGVSTDVLRRHFKAIGFVPCEVQRYDVVLAALRELLSSVDCQNVGTSFATALLQSERGIHARPADVHRALRAHDPSGHKKRAKEATKTQYIYNVAGPRSLYHADAHEKLAKIWGMWIHLLIDGYSRYIIYLHVAPNKHASTVQELFRAACDEVGWAARVRWDKGTENAGAISEQLRHHQRHDDGHGRWRGCAITGRSSQNCRAEYIWNFLKRHVSAPYRELFFSMMRELKILDPSSKTDLFCLQAVFLPRVQASCDRFRRMWNHHRIRGRRTVCGHGGGVPVELFHDPVEDRVRRDDAAYSQQGGVIDADGVDRDDDSCTYGVAEPFKGDTIELTERELPTLDPLDCAGPIFPLLAALRTAYFEAVSFESDQKGIDEYIEYKLVCRELLGIFVEGWVVNGRVNWDGFEGAATDPDGTCVRAKLAELGRESQP